MPARFQQPHEAVFRQPYEICQGAKTYGSPPLLSDYYVYFYLRTFTSFVLAFDLTLISVQSLQAKAAMRRALLWTRQGVPEV